MLELLIFVRIVAWFSVVTTLILLAVWGYYMWNNRTLPERIEIANKGSAFPSTKPQTLSRRTNEMQATIEAATTNRTMVGSLVILTEAPQRTVTLYAGETVIGRVLNISQNITIGLAERSVSSQHARFRTDGNRFFLRDLSRNGTFVYHHGQERKLETGEEIELYDGDTVRFGMTVEAMFNLSVRR